MIVNCEICGKEKEIYPSYFKRAKHHYCSIECRLKGMFGKTKKGKKQLGKIFICLVCGKEEEVIKSSKRKYCSRKCYHQSRKLLTD